VQDAGAAAQQGCAMLGAVEAAAGRLDADQPHLLVGDELGEGAHRVGAAAHAGDHRVGQAALFRQHLGARFLADHALELAHHQREGVGAGDGAEQIVRVGEARRPVAQRFVDRVLEAAAAAFDRHHLGAHQLHAEHVELLPLDIVRAHVDAGRQAEQGADDRGGDAMLAGAGLGDQPRLAHLPGEQGLPQHLVGLVRAAVEQVLALQVDARALIAEIAAEGERRRAAGIIGEQAGELGLEIIVELGREEGGFELLQRGHQDFRHISAAISAETSSHQHGRSSPERGGGPAAGWWRGPGDPQSVR
jgi:hypothetical protein